MKLLRDLAFHLQFGLVVLGIASLVIALGMLGQRWSGPQDAVVVSESVSPEPLPEPPEPRPQPPQPSAPSSPISTVPSDLTQFPEFPPSPSTNPASSPTVTPPPLPPVTPTPNPTASVVATRPDQNLYGHLPYPVISTKDLVIAGDYYGRQERLQKDAAVAFKKMKAAANRQGTTLKLASGFRDQRKQQQLFDRQVQRKGSKQAAAKWSAPPGYSEHHTGYALDIGDGSAADFKLAFEQTKAYRWLVNHAQHYGFELSFPKNNSQGVSFEPWHWRYVGNATAQQVFRIATRSQG